MPAPDWRARKVEECSDESSLDHSTEVSPCAFCRKILS